MKRFFASLKQLQLRQILAVFFAGMLVLVTAACQGPNSRNVASTKVPQQAANANEKQGIPGHIYQDYEGGMNGYSDIDPRRQTTGSALSKAKGLRDNAERNVIDMTDDVGTNTKRILDKKGENADQFGDNLKASTKSLGQKADKAGTDIKNVTERVQDNTKSAGKTFARDARNAADDVQDSARNTGGNLVDNLKQSADNSASFVQDKTRNLGDNLSQGSSNAVRNPRQLGDDVASGAQRTINDISDNYGRRAIEDASQASRDRA